MRAVCILIYVLRCVNITPREVGAPLFNTNHRLCARFCNGFPISPLLPMMYDKPERDFYHAMTVRRGNQVSMIDVDKAYTVDSIPRYRQDRQAKYGWLYQVILANLATDTHL